MDELAQQLSTRDAALLTWIVAALALAAGSAVRGEGVGRQALRVLPIVAGPRMGSAILLVSAWQVGLVWAAAQVGLWNHSLLFDTAVIVSVASVTAGFKALAILEGEQTWRDEVRSIVTLVVIFQWISNVGTFPYWVELLLVPVAAMLGGMQALAGLRDEYAAIRPFINGPVVLLGWAILAWSLYRVGATWRSTEWEGVGLSFLLAFWLPAVLLPAVYIEALVMGHGSIVSAMKIVRPPSLGARLDLCVYHGLSLARLIRLYRSPNTARAYARANDRAERQAILRSEGAR